MSFISGNPFAGLGGSAVTDFDRPQNDLAPGPSAAERPDRVVNARIGGTLPIAFPDPGAGNVAGDGSGGGFGAIFSNILQSIATLLGQLAAYFGSGMPSATSAPEARFANATASSVGDPHDAFDGTTADGAQRTGRFDDMHGRDELLDSDSFAGGYRVATTSTPPGPNGATYNASATVTTHGGATSVTLERDGTYAVRSDGATLSLAPGVATSLGDGERVTLGADKSLTIVDTNGSGSLTTTLALDANGGVDVRASASDVDLGGYLVERSSGTPAAPSPVASAPAPVPWSPDPVTQGLEFA